MMRRMGRRRSAYWRGPAGAPSARASPLALPPSAGAGGNCHSACPSSVRQNSTNLRANSGSGPPRSTDTGSGSTNTAPSGSAYPTRPTRPPPTASAWARKPKRFGASFKRELARARNVRTLLNLSATRLVANADGNAIESL